MSDETFRAVILEQEDKKTKLSIKNIGFDALPNEDTLVKIDYSTLNYKDALAITGKGKIVRSWPLVPGIDFAGTVVESNNKKLQPGTRVVLTGWGVGEKYWGGYSQYQRIRSDMLVPLPDSITNKQSMMIGTAGLEAMLSIMALEDNGIKPEAGPVLVTGAAGGVGSVAVAVLSNLGYEVVALTGKEHKHEHVKSLGSVSFVDGPHWLEKPRALETQQWAAAIDTVGTHVLARVLAETNYNGSVAACGLAGGADLHTTVMPFILRGIKLIGVDSVMQPVSNRVSAWDRLGRDLPKEKLDLIVTNTIGLDAVELASHDLMDGKLKGRLLIDVNI